MEEAFSLQDFMWIRAQFQVVVVPPLYMASPFRRKSKERKSSKKEDDTDLEEVIEAEEPLEENVAEVLESLFHRNMGTKEQFMTRVTDLYRFEAIQGHLGWDQETIMPKKGSDSRSDILSWLAAERHNRIIDPEMGRLLSELEDDNSLDDDQSANVREMRRTYDKSVLLPSDFVAEFAKARSEALLSWQKARADSDFGAFQPQLQHLVDLSLIHI